MTVAGSAEDERAYAALKQAVIQRTGHDYYRDKDELLRERLARRLAATGCVNLSAYQSLLGTPRKGDVEWQELEAEVTIGETFFFRHQEQVSALRDIILPALIAQAALTRRLRLWSAGCAVGAEAYSLAILLERALREAKRDWSIEIIGTDINGRALAEARLGQFSEWALRGLAPEERGRDFVQTGPRRWQIAERHRRSVRFERHNLLELREAASASAWRGFDLILCRNVLIYFGTQQISGTLAALSRCLSPEGWLMVGHSDALAALPPELAVVELPGTMAFRLPTSPRPASSQARPATAPATATATAPAADAEAVAPPLPDAAPTRLPPRPDQAPTAMSLTAIRALADQGRLDAAATALGLALRHDPLDARLHLYEGLIGQATGDAEAAERAFRRAIYLSGEMVMAHYHLGLLLTARGAMGEGARFLAQAQRLCAGLPEDSALPDGDDLTPRVLLERLRARRPASSAPAGRLSEAPHHGG